MKDISMLVELLSVAHEKMIDADKEQPNSEEDQFEDGSNYGAVCGKVAAYKDMVEWAATRICEEL